MTLFKLHNSPFAHTDFMSLLQRITSEDGVLLTQDAVYALRHTKAWQSLTQTHAEIFILQQDLLARGLSNNSAAKEVDYAQMVALCLRFDNVVSW